jgi:hypothetical protein
MLTVEDVEDKNEHTLLDLGSRYKGSGGNKLERTLHQVHVPLGRELYPVDEAAVSTLSCGHKGEEPVPRKEPVGVEKVDDVKHRGVARESHCCIEGRWGGKATTLSPMVVVEEQERLHRLLVVVSTGNVNHSIKTGSILKGVEILPFIEFRQGYLIPYT